MTADHPVVFGVTRPASFDRMQIVLRVAILALFLLVKTSLAALFAFLYLVLPVFAALAIGQRGAARFLAEDAPRMERALRWMMGAFAYLALVTDHLPGDATDEGVRFAIEPGAWPAPEGARGPSVTTALLRIVTGLPSALVLCVLGVASTVTWLAAAVMILLTEHYPDALYDFQCGVLRWQARLFAYVASLVEPYPPFSFDTGQVGGIHDLPAH